MSKRKEVNPNTVPPRDGHDNTGTQGYDSLSDDAFTGTSQKHVDLPTDVDGEILVAVDGGDYRGEQIIFDIVIKEKLAHVIVIKEDSRYHINLDGEDLGAFSKDDKGKIHRFQQPKGAIAAPDDYFTAIEEKLKTMNK